MRSSGVFVPTFFRSSPFLQDWHTLSQVQKERFKSAVREMVEDLRAKRGFRASLRVKRVRRVRDVFEMTWAPDGRATFEYGPEQRPGEAHIIWRRIGGHDLFNNP
jgi:hypothetical protein